MNPVQISLKYLLFNKWTLFLNVLLVAFGTGILTILLLGMTQVGQKLKGNAEGIDLVVGAKGSPLQLILSSVYFVDFPTGNITVDDAEQLAKNPMVKRAVPLALGDNYEGFRIVGTDTGYVSLYNLQLAQGKIWQKDFEIVIGSEVARLKKLTVGDKIYGAHGLTSKEDLHAERANTITGILKPSGKSIDNLVLTSIPSIWAMHDIHEDGKKEITSLLIQYRSHMAIVIFPLLVNKSTSMQAASPAKESARLFSLIGVGVDTLQWFAFSLMSIACISVFVSLYNALRERMYDLAIMRITGASQRAIFLIVMIEGVLITCAGSMIGMLAGHIGLQLIGFFQESSQAKITGLFFMREEGFLLLGGMLVGILASVIPAVKAYSIDIAKIIAK